MMMTIIAVWRFVCSNSVCAGSGPEFGYRKSGQVVKLRREALKLEGCQRCDSKPPSDSFNLT